jgi:hypothetical protein
MSNQSLDLPQDLNFEVLNTKQKGKDQLADQEVDGKIK